ncbi:MAG: prenyltransferase/squalene oxidase repeat-containing protein [Verrucomicrobiota bacterium]
MKRLALSLLLSSFIIHPSSFAETNAVARGLAWLVAQQRPDGSWSTNVALNSLPVLAFLSAGHTLDDKPHGERLNRAVRFILSQQSPEGAFTNGGALMFGHGMTTLMLAEVAGMNDEGTKLTTHLNKAVHFILRAQAIEKGDIHAGGWRYFPDSKDSDLAVSIWQIAALRAAITAGARVPTVSLERAARYITRCKRPDGGFAYQPGGQPNQGRTAAGMIALRMCNQFESTAIDRGREWLKEHPLKWEDEYVYHSAFFCANIKLAFDEALLERRQLPDGSWPAPPNCVDETDAGPLYRTAMAILALTARDHYLPVFMVND